MEPITSEKLAEIQKDLSTLCEKHQIELRPVQRLEISVFPKEQAEPKVETGTDTPTASV